MQAELTPAEEAELVALAMLDADGEAWRVVGPIVRAVRASAGIDAGDLADEMYEPHRWANPEDDSNNSTEAWAAAEAASRRRAGQ